MIVRAALVLLAVIVVLSLVERWRRRLSRPPARPPVEAARRCPDCGTYIVGAGPCTRADCPSRSA